MLTNRAQTDAHCQEVRHRALQVQWRSVAWCHRTNLSRDPSVGEKLGFFQGHIWNSDSVGLDRASLVGLRPQMGSWWLRLVASWAGFSHLSYPIPGQGKWVKRVVLFFGLFWWGVGERGIYMEPVLVRTEEYVRCPVLLLFALSHTESFISSLNPELAVFR